MKHFQPRLLGVAMLLALMAGCGGGSAPPATATNPADASGIPASAAQSVDGFLGFMHAETGMTSESREPRDVSRFTPPVDDAGDPDPSS